MWRKKIKFKKKKFKNEFQVFFLLFIKVVMLCYAFMSLVFVFGFVWFFFLDKIGK